jgi:hypothetical protein
MINKSSSNNSISFDFKKYAVIKKQQTIDALSSMTTFFTVEETFGRR